jgi:hypothetical protein
VAALLIVSSPRIELPFGTAEAAKHAAGVVHGSPAVGANLTAK